jgi:hypothetical protein
MAPLEDFLRRFRPLVAPPGLAGPGAVPVDRTADLLAELAGVLAAIDGVEDEVARMEAVARVEADERTASGRAEGARLIAQASELAPRERATVYAEHRRAGESEIRSQIEAAGREALQIRRKASERLPELTDTVVHRLLDTFGA